MLTLFIICAALIGFCLGFLFAALFAAQEREELLDAIRKKEENNESTLARETSQNNGS